MSYSDYAAGRERRVAERLHAELVRNLRVGVAPADEHLKGGCFDCDCFWSGYQTRVGIAAHRDNYPKHTTWVMEAVSA